MARLAWGLAVQETARAILGSIPGNGACPVLGEVAWFLHHSEQHVGDTEKWPKSILDHFHFSFFKLFF